MSNAGQALLTIGGTIIGAMVGFPQLGFVLGSLAGQALFPTELPGVHGPKLTDARTTNASIGAPVSEIFGTDVVAGNVIWTGPIETVTTTEEVGGKGGPSQKQTTYTYFQPIAIGLCRGPMGGILRIWENGQCVYDVREQQDGESDSAYTERLTSSDVYFQGCTLYAGSEEQAPDPTMESFEGVGRVPGFRGLMYIVYSRRQILDTQGLRHPNFKFEVTDTLILTSKVYPLEVIETMDTDGDIVSARTLPPPVDNMLTSGGIVSAVNPVILVSQSAPIEEMNTGAEIIQALVDYPSEPEIQYSLIEEMNTGGAIVSAQNPTVLITYDDWPPENMLTSGSIVSGEMT